MHTPRQGYVGVWCVAGTFLVIVAGIASYLVERGRADAVELARSRAAQTAAHAETLVNRAFLSIDVLLAGLEDLVALEQSRSGNVDPLLAQRALAGVVRRSLLVRDVALVGDDGAVVASALPVTRRLGLPLPGRFLGSAWQQSPPSMTVSQPAESFNTAETVIHFARPFGTSQGSRLLAVAVVPAAQVSAALAPGEAASLAVMTLEREDGQLIVGMPQTGMPASRRLASPLASTHRDGVARLAAGRLDGTPSLVAARSLLHSGLLVAVSIPMSDVLAGWQKERRRIWTAAALLGLAIVATAAGLHHYIRRMHLARAAIAEGKTWLDQALASIRDGLLLCDGLDRVVAWNQRYVAFYPWLASLIRPGVPYEVLVRRSVAEMFAERSAQEQEDLVQQRLRAHRREFSEFEHAVNSDLVIRITETATPGGGVVSVFRDVTAAERALARAEAAKEAAEASRLHFASGLAQAVARPANTALGAAELLLRTPLSGEQRRCVDWARSSGREITSIVHDLLDMTTLSSGPVRLACERFDPAAVLREAISQVRHTLPAANLDVELLGSDQLPASVYGDAGRVRQAVRGLVAAAAETAGGACEIELRAHAEPTGSDAMSLVLLLTGNDPVIAQSLMHGLRGTGPPTAATAALRVSAKLCELMGGDLAGVAAGDGAIRAVRMRISVKPEVESANV